MGTGKRGHIGWPVGASSCFNAAVRHSSLPEKNKELHRGSHALETGGLSLILEMSHLDHLLLLATSILIPSLAQSADGHPFHFGSLCVSQI